jgi:hypothetical protein
VVDDDGFNARDADYSFTKEHTMKTEVNTNGAEALKMLMADFARIRAIAMIAGMTKEEADQIRLAVLTKIGNMDADTLIACVQKHVCDQRNTWKTFCETGNAEYAIKFAEEAYHGH